MSGTSVTGASERLSKVWRWLAGEAEAAIMLDTDLFVKGSLDHNFYLVQHAALAGSCHSQFKASACAAALQPRTCCTWIGNVLHGDGV